MKYAKAINMAITAVTMDKLLEMQTKREIIEALSKLSYELEEKESEANGE